MGDSDFFPSKEITIYVERQVHKKLKFISSSSIILVNGALCWLWTFRILTIDSDDESAHSREIISIFQWHFLKSIFRFDILAMISRYFIDIYVNISIAENNYGMYPIGNIWAKVVL